MTRRVLVTGATGFAGQHLCRHLAKSGYDVFGGINDDQELPFPSRDFDLRDADSVRALVAWAAPIDAVAHLAAMTFVPHAVRGPEAVMDVNLLGTIRLLDAIRECAPETRILFVSSSEVYGRPERLPVDEEHPLRPGNPYAISKAAADAYCGYAAQADAANIVRVRPFNHSGPGQSDQFVLASFARQLAEMEAGARDPVLHVGNLEAARDFTHVADVVRAYEILLEHGESGGVYNVCSGESYRIQDALDALLGMTNLRVDVRVDPERLRPVDVPEIRGSHARLTSATGWAPAVSFERLLADLLDYWRARCQAATP